MLVIAVASADQCNGEQRDPLEWKREPLLCYSGPDSFSNRLDCCDVVVLIRSVPDEDQQPMQPATQDFVVVNVVRRAAAAVAIRDRVVVPGRRAVRPNEVYLLAGRLDDEDFGKNIHWIYFHKVTSDCFNYVASMPGPERPTPERLLHFVEHLDSPDPQIQEDVYTELAFLSYDQLRPLAKQLPTEKLRKCLTEPRTQPRVVDLSALLLRLCGNDQDIDLLARAVEEPDNEFRVTLDEAMIGYLLIAGETGLASLEQSRLQRKGVQFFEKYSVLQAIEILSRFEPGRIRPERLQESMRLFLDEPELADFAIYDLARMRDWSVRDRLMEMYGQEQFNVRRIKKAIVSYMLRSESDARPGARGADAKQAEKAKACLATLRERDPELVNDVEKVVLRIGSSN